MKYELLLLDADDTLFDYKKGEEFAFFKSLEEFGISYEFDSYLDQYRSINSRIWKEFERKEITAEELKTERFKRLFEATGLDKNPADFSNTYLKNLSYATFLIPGVDELLNELSGNIRLAIITNGLTKVQRPRFDRSRIGHFIESYIISEEIGLQKPDPAIFKYTLDKLDHVRKESVLIVGDNINSDILGGITFGIDTCWYNPANQPVPNGIHPTYLIHDIRDIKSILL